MSRLPSSLTSGNAGKRPLAPARACVAPTSTAGDNSTNSFKSGVAAFRPSRHTANTTKTESDDDEDGDLEKGTFLAGIRPPSVDVGEEQSMPSRKKPTVASLQAQPSPPADYDGSSSKPKAWQRVVLAVIGMREDASCWGRENYDWGIHGTRQEPWYAESPSKHGHEVQTWWSMPLHRVPSIRHLWGEAQYELHPGAQELFLDLIFVGVAYRIGSVLKAAFYSCTPTDAFLAAPHSQQLHECLGLPLGLVHSLAPFVCMYLMWQVETAFRAKFDGCKQPALRPPRPTARSLTFDRRSHPLCNAFARV